MMFELGSWSASTSPNRSPSPIRYAQVRRRNQQQKTAYGTTSLRQRSRSPSPARLQEVCERDGLAEDEMGMFLYNFNHRGLDKVEEYRIRIRGFVRNVTVCPFCCSATRVRDLFVSVFFVIEVIRSQCYKYEIK